jgi:hypothetical protein
MPTGVIDVATRVRTVADSLSIDAGPLLRVLSQLGPAMTAKLEWSDAGDRLRLGVPWNARDDMLFRTYSSRDRLQAKTVPAIVARVPPSWLAFETVPRKPDLLATELGVWGSHEPGAILTTLHEAGTIIKPAAADEMSRLWSRTAIPCDLFVDRAQPPLGPNLWRFSGPIPPDHLVRTADALISDFGILEPHRALAQRFATYRSVRLGLDAVFDGVHPVLVVEATGLEWPEVEAVLGTVLHDPTRAARVVRALSATGAHTGSVTVRLADEDPIRVRVGIALT